MLSVHVVMDRTSTSVQREVCACSQVCDLTMHCDMVHEALMMWNLAADFTCMYVCFAGGDTLLALALRLSPGGRPGRPLLNAILALALEVRI